MTNPRKPGLGVFIALGLLVTFAVLFVVVFVAASSQQPGPEIVSNDLETQAAAVLANADPARGAELVVTHQCVNCHIYAAGLSAPGWNGLADRAANRQSPLSAAAYLYESVTMPGAYLVEGYPASMPQNFKDVLTTQELGDILAYLLTMHAGA